MPVVERSQEEPHFSEGEPDLEPPEELAVGEIDEQTMLEDDLDNEDVAEEEVDEDLLTVTLEDLVHHDDADDEEGERAAGNGFPALDVELSTELEEELEVLEVDDLEDVEESLDHVLEERLADPAGPGSATDGDEDTPLSPVLAWTLAAAAARTTRCQGEEEFLCGACFLVRNRALLVDSEKLLCRDCAG